jgi:PAS fold.
MGFGPCRSEASSDAVRRIPRQHGVAGIFFGTAIPALVLEAVVRLLTNPLFIRMALGLVAAAAAFVIGIVGMRLLRRGMTEGGMVSANSGFENALPLHTASVSQQLKQQKFALQSEQQQERQRSKTSEHITAAIMASLPCGIVFVALNGLVRQTNAAARQILGFASPQGMSVEELFRGARIVSDPEADVKDAFDSVMRGDTRGSNFDCHYSTPDKQERTLRFILTPVSSASGEILGIAAAISDESEAHTLREAEMLKQEISAEMALELRTSLATIRERAERIHAAADPCTSQSVASDISTESERIERIVGGFLAGRERAGAAGA